MKKRIFRYGKRALLTILILVPVIIYIGYSMGARVHYGDNPLALNWVNEGPYIFFKNDSILNVNYIKGTKDDGYYVKQENYQIDSLVSATCYYPLDTTQFSFPVKTDFETPSSIYNDNNQIFVMSDIESNYKTFRDFLLNSKVIDEDLNWTFGAGHLVLVGDFIDRGYFTTQLLWFIYKLEQDAEIQGGNVHYIVGNHELKMMHGNYSAADPKYDDVASLLGVHQIEFYSSKSLIGRWLASKNAIELINNHLFVHGGLHPDLPDSKLSIEEINQIIRRNYYYNPYDANQNKTDKTQEEELLLSPKLGPCWYRGYFKDHLTQEQIDRQLDYFNARSVVVGHTIQTQVNRIYNGKVIAIDVQHPNDDHKQWPEGESEALLIEGDKYYRVFANGEKEEI